jgi:dipeptidyl-peptidase-4
MISWCTIVVLFCTLPSSDASLITVDRIFGSHDFDVEKVAPFRWSKRSTDYFTLETPPTGGKGRDFVRNASATGKKEVIVSANDFIPAEKNEPIELEAFDLSTDESKLLIFTKSKRVWRRNTRGDYWVMDLANRELKQLGGDAKSSTLMFCKFSPDGTRVGPCVSPSRIAERV